MPPFAAMPRFIFFFFEIFGAFSPSHKEAPTGCKKRTSHRPEKRRTPFGRAIVCACFFLFFFHVLFERTPLFFLKKKRRARITPNNHHSKTARAILINKKGTRSAAAFAKRPMAREQCEIGVCFLVFSFPRLAFLSSLFDAPAKVQEPTNLGTSPQKREGPRKKPDVSIPCFIG